MRLAVALATLAACSAPSARTRVEPGHPPVAVDPPTQGDAPIPTVHEPRPAIEAPHGGSIVTLAVTPDGSAVLSADELGGIRLWPALDGSIEPRILELPTPKALAVGRHATGFTAVALDEVGGLYIAKLDSAGTTL